MHIIRGDWLIIQHYLPLQQLEISQELSIRLESVACYLYNEHDWQVLFFFLLFYNPFWIYSSLVEVLLRLHHL